MAHFPIITDIVLVKGGVTSDSESNFTNYKRMPAKAKGRGFLKVRKLFSLRAGHGKGSLEKLSTRLKAVKLCIRQECTILREH